MEALAWRWLLAGCAGAIALALTWPFTDFMVPPEWARVEWYPFQHGFSGLDETANLVLFFPLGYIACRVAPDRGRDIVAAATLLSLGAEFRQVFSHIRFASATDVLMNAIGTAAGFAGAHLTRAVHNAQLRRR